MRATRHLILFPGLGADARLFHRQLSLDAQIEVPPWIAPIETESLAEYAARMAATIRTKPPFYLGGCSFGGMIALEVARHIYPKAVILMASCRTHLSVNQALLGIAPLARLMPKWMLRLSSRSTPPSLRHVVGAASKMLRWGPGAIAQWPGVTQCDVPVFHIHGGCDRIIPARDVAADHVVRTAGHLINLTHAEEVNAFIAGVFAQVEAREASPTPSPPPTPLPPPPPPSQT
jgi:pimeloyl-ACP methyl ester carboxylesterase